MWQRLTIDRGGWLQVVHCLGLGPAILMLPSLGRPADDLEPVGELLASRGHRVAIMEFRGCGGSGGPLTGLSLDDYAMDVRTVIAELALAPVHLIGAPFGSRVVRRLLAKRDPAVWSATIIAAGGSIAPDAETVASARRFMAGLGKESPAVLAELARTLYFSPAFQPRPDWLEDEWLGGWSIEAMMSQRAAIHASGADDDLSGLWVPLLILQGVDDRIAPPANARLLASRAGKATELVEIAAAGHMLAIERPHEVADAIAAFVERQTGTLDRSH